MLTIHWSPRYKQEMALLDTGAKCTLIHDQPQRCSGPLSTDDGYRRQTLMISKVPHENMKFSSLQYQRTCWSLIFYKVSLQASTGDL